MCFTPAVSISIAILEWVLAGILIFKFKKSILRDFFALLIVLLGFYQFTEFMLCVTSHSHFWARMGFIAYTFLPAVELHALLLYYRKKPYVGAVYCIPVIAALIAIGHPFFIISAECTPFFVQVNNVFGMQVGLAYQLFNLVYMAYYFLFILGAAFMAIQHYQRNTNRVLKSIDHTIVLGILLMIVPTFILLVVFPSLRIRFPSVLCGFGVLYALSIFRAVWLERRMPKK